MVQYSNRTCSTGTSCCVASPCLCGTYLNCKAGSGCLSATCEDCPAGYFCDCLAACTRTGGLSLAQSCPPGFYCTGSSGYPTPCPSGTYSTQQLASSQSVCTTCGFGLSSESGSTQCQISNISKIAIGVSIGGFFSLLLAILIFCYCRRQKALEAEQEFVRNYRQGQQVPLHLMAGASFVPQDDFRNSYAPSAPLPAEAPAGVIQAAIPWVAPQNGNSSYPAAQNGANARAGILAAVWNTRPSDDEEEVCV